MFAIVLGSTRLPIVILVGVVTSIYTAVGGLYVSLWTDQLQVGQQSPSPHPPQTSGPTAIALASTRLPSTSLVGAPAGMAVGGLCMALWPDAQGEPCTLAGCSVSRGGASWLARSPARGHGRVCVCPTPSVTP